MLNVITVKTGSAYSNEYVNKMRSMLSRHLNIPHEFYCLTESPGGVDAKHIDVPCYLPGWWNKLYLFSDFMPSGPLLYLDLDQVILGDITEIVEECLNHPFSCYADHIEWHGVKLGTSMMTFEAHSLTDIFDRFWVNQNRVMEQFQHGGDQVYLGQFLDNVYYFNEDFPDAVKSYKFDLRAYDLEPDKLTKLVNFHGKPKPHELQLKWIDQHWR